MSELDVYRLHTSVIERDGVYHVRVTASLGERLHGTIARERACDSRQSAEITEGLLIEQIRAAVKTIGAAMHFAESRPHGGGSDEEPAE